MISTDTKIFQEGSAVRARQVEYAKEWKEVHIVVFDKLKNQIYPAKAGQAKIKNTSHQIQREQVIATNCWAYSTASASKLFATFSVMKLGRFLIERRGVTDITCQDPFLTSMAGVSLKKQFPDVRLEIQVHTDIGSPRFTYSFANKARKFLALNYLPKADHIRVVSERIKGWIERLGIERLKDSAIEIRPIFVDTEKIKNAPIVEGADLHKKYPQFDKIALMASRLEPEKNIGYALEIWAEVVKDDPKAGLVIVGSGSQNSKVKTQKSKLGLDSAVIFEDWVDQETLYSYYKTADLFLNTSLYEGYGMTLVEARAAGCTVVSTDVGVAQEVRAKIIPFDDPKKTAEMLIDTLR